MTSTVTQTKLDVMFVEEFLSDAEVTPDRVFDIVTSESQDAANIVMLIAGAVGEAGFQDTMTWSYIAGMVAVAHAVQPDYNDVWQMLLAYATKIVRMVG